MGTPRGKTGWKTRFPFGNGPFLGTFSSIFHGIFRNFPATPNYGRLKTHFWKPEKSDENVGFPAKTALSRIWPKSDENVGFSGKNGTFSTFPGRCKTDGRTSDPPGTFWKNRAKSAQKCPFLGLFSAENSTFQPVFPRGVPMVWQRKRSSGPIFQVLGGRLQKTTKNAKNGLKCWKWRKVTFCTFC